MGVMRNHIGLCCLSWVVLLAGVGGCATRQAAPNAAMPPQSGSVTIRAYVDGQDVLFIDGQSMWWEHLDSHSAAVGRYNGNRATFVNGTPWYPRWDAIDEYRKPMSSKEDLVPYGPTIPRYRDTMVMLTKIDGGRAGGPSVKLLPRATSRSPVRLQIDNTGSSHDAKWVEATLTWTTTTAGLPDNPHFATIESRDRTAFTDH